MIFIEKSTLRLGTGRIEVSHTNSAHTKSFLNQLEVSVKLKRVRALVGMNWIRFHCKNTTFWFFQSFFFSSMSDERDIDHSHDFWSGLGSPGYSPNTPRALQTEPIVTISVLMFWLRMNSSRISEISTKTPRFSWYRGIQRSLSFRIVSKVFRNLKKCFPSP